MNFDPTLSLVLLGMMSMLNACFAVFMWYTIKQYKELLQNEIKKVRDEVGKSKSDSAFAKNSAAECTAAMTMTVEAFRGEFRSLKDRVEQLSLAVGNK